MDQPPDLIAGDKLQLEYWDSSSKGGCSPRKSLFTHPFKCPFYVSSAFTVKTQAKQLKKKPSKCNSGSKCRRRWKADGGSWVPDFQQQADLCRGQDRACALGGFGVTAGQVGNSNSTEAHNSHFQLSNSN